MQKARYVAALGIPLLALLSFTLAAAWSGPTAPPPGNNVAAPINVGTTGQVKDGALGVNSLTVFGNSLFGGSTGSNAYLNFGPTYGSSGYGIRDNAGLLEFKNSGGSWASLQSIIFTLGGAWTTSGNNIYNANTGNVGIGTTSPTQKLDVTGYVRGSSGLCIGSDCRTAWPGKGSNSYWSNSGIAVKYGNSGSTYCASGYVMTGLNLGYWTNGYQDLIYITALCTN